MKRRAESQARCTDKYSTQAVAATQPASAFAMICIVCAKFGKAHCDIGSTM
jgi:hypothetical protein